MSKSSGSRREALRAQQEAQARAARNRKMVAVGAGLVALVLAIVLGVVAVQSMNAGGGKVTPPNAVVNQYGVEAGTNPDKVPDGIGVAQDKAKPGAPVVMVFADYQCPGCKTFDDAFGAKLNELARAGEIKYSVQIETFLDRFGAGTSTNPAIAAACADTVGKFPEYHLAVFKGQPTQEGTGGYPTEQLRATFPAAAGIAGDDLKKFQQCFDTKATAEYVENQNKFNTAWTGLKSEKAGGAKTEEGKSWGSTPLITVNGKMLDKNALDVNNPSSVLDAIKKTAA